MMEHCQPKIVILLEKPARKTLRGDEIIFVMFISTRVSQFGLNNKTRFQNVNKFEIADETLSYVI